MKNLINAFAELGVAKGKLHTELIKEFPIGTYVTFMISPRQINSSSGTVVGYRDNGKLNVEHHQAKKHSRYSHRDVSFQFAVKV